MEDRSAADAVGQTPKPADCYRPHAAVLRLLKLAG